MEIWKDIKGYEGLYQVSNLGKIKSVEKDIVRVRNGKEIITHIPEKILFQWKNSRGYLSVIIGPKQSRKAYKIHRLVAEAFIPNPNNLPQVNHIDEDKSNNKVENLEWCTNKYNCNYGTYNIRLSEKLKGRKVSWLTKAVIQCSMNGEFIREFKSVRDAAKAVKSSPANISMCCKGIYNSCKGFKWKYK